MLVFLGFSCGILLSLLAVAGLHSWQWNGQGKLLAGGAGVLAGLGILLLLAPEGGSLLVVDDAFYYLEMAGHVAATGTPSFDGIHPTSGFHLLWLCLLAALRWAFPVARESFVIGVQILGFFFLLATVPWLRRLLAGRFGTWPTLVTLAVFANPWALMRFWPGGMEAPVTAFLLVAWLTLHKELFDTPRPHLLQWLIAGTIGGLLTLTRLDLLIVVTAMGVGLWGVRGAGRARWGGLAAWAAAAGLPTLLWMVGNRVAFGRWGTVSGHLKWTRQSLTWLDRYDQLTRVLPSFRHFDLTLPLRFLFPVLLACLVMLAVRAFRRLPAGGLRRVLSTFAAGALVHYVIVRLAIGESFSWYFVPTTLALALTLGACWQAGERWRRRRWLDAAALAGLASHALLVVDLLSPAPRFFLSRGIHRQFQEAAGWLNENLPLGTRIGSWDAGTLGYYCDHPVVNLDGLAGSWEFADMAAEGRYEEFVDAAGITVLANPFYEWPEGSYWQARWGMGAFADRVEIAWCRPPVPYLGHNVAMVILHLRPRHSPAPTEDVGMTLPIPDGCRR
jgi:hypothetical protein